MVRTALALVVGIGVGVVGMAAAHDEGEKVAVVFEGEIAEKLDGKAAKATFVEVTIGPGEEGAPHRHPGPGFGYVLEGEYEWAVDDQPARVLKVGETFYEPTGCLHRVSRNPAAKGKTRVLAVVLQPRDSGPIAVPEPKK
ncbi:cupin domain-containing protein [Paludisphaera mucosa]|uniref:Cupin domain-containing protein n=1 Tax=Paludisphaera mucosa TaxID=3030827 RepID=A0ABT6FJV4_9BACT|nr:cupin domain-containing protein [Paludisphaera mucosa]MDG3007863.1 cupin domain-containing protein [Paludisphaera mucosa]